MKLPQIEEYLNSVELPKTWDFSKHERVLDVKAFVDGHILFLKSNPSNRLFKPYYDRLLKFCLDIKENK